MRVLLANPRCCCAGVDRAVEIVDVALKRFGAPVYVRKEIVHNSHVVESFRERGVIFVEELDEVPPGAVTVFSAHGVSPAVESAAAGRSLTVIDATCPLVTKVHSEVIRFVKEGYHVLLVGHQGHEEVEGTMGFAPDNITLVENVSQATEMEIAPAAKYMILMQTTLSVDDTREIVDSLRKRLSNVELPPSEDICYATQNRQNAVKEMCGRGIDLLLVVGSWNSSNAKRLAEVATSRGIEARLIDGAGEIVPDWVVNAVLVGVTGGASTPDALVQGVVDRLRALGAESVELCTTAEENTVFKLPPILADAKAKAR